MTTDSTSDEKRSNSIHFWWLSSVVSPYVWGKHFLRVFHHQNGTRETILAADYISPGRDHSTKFFLPRAPASPPLCARPSLLRQATHRATQVRDPRRTAPPSPYSDHSLRHQALSLRLPKNDRPRHCRVQRLNSGLEGHADPDDVPVLQSQPRGFA